MGEFDDVLAMEPGDEWDDYDTTDRFGPGGELPPLVAELHAPAATVELRGEVPPDVLGRLDALTAAPLVRSPRHVVVPLSFERIDVAGTGGDAVAGPGNGGWRLTDHGRGEVVDLVGPVDQVVRDLSDLVCDVAAAADPRQLMVPVAGARLADGRGVLIIEPDRRRRHALLAALVADGAGYVGADRVVLQAGSRTVLACPTPLDEGLPVTADRVAAAMTVSMVVVSDPLGDAVEPLSSPHGCARLLVTTLPGSPDAGELLRCVAGITAAAATWSVPTDDTSSFAGLVGRLDAAPSPQLVTWRHPSAAHPDLVTIRFGHGGVVVDLGGGRALEVDESELPVIDALGWQAPQPDPPARASLLTQLADAGVDLHPVLAARPAPVPGPESFGLPDGPRGGVIAGWAGAPLERSLAGAASLALLVEHAVCSGELALDDDQRAAVSARAAALLEGSARADAALELVLSALEGGEVDPILLGPAVAACDGSLPAEVVEREHLDLLLPDEAIDRQIELIESAGGVPVDGSPDESEGSGSGPGPVVRRFAVEGGSVDVRVHTRLAGGPFGELVDHDELHHRAVPVRVGHRWVRTLHPDDRFVAACVQVADSSEASIRDLRHVVLSAPVSREGASAVFEASARWGATRTVLASVRMVGERLPGLSPWLVERATRPTASADRRRRGLRRR